MPELPARQDASREIKDGSKKFNYHQAENTEKHPKIQQHYDQQWAIALLDQVMKSLEGELEQAGKAKQFEELKGFIAGDYAGTTFAQAAETLNMTEAAAAKAASRMRQRYRELLRQEISQTVAGPDEIEDEICNLFATLDL